MFQIRNRNQKSSALLAGILALAMGATLGACTKESGDNAATKETATAQTGNESGEKATGEAPAAAKTGEHGGHADVSEVLTHYDAVHALLVDDKGSEIAAHAQKLQAAAEKALAAAPDAAKAHLEALAKQAQALAAVPAEDLAQMRKTFGELSKPLVTMMSEMPAMAMGRHLFECPMADGYNRWVQKDAKLANPYMGQSMPGCGSEVAWAQGESQGHAHGEAHDHAHGEAQDHAHGEAHDHAHGEAHDH